jgi:hypothetical protein
MLYEVGKNWTIKNVPTRVAEEMSAEAKSQQLTMAQLVEKMWNLWRASRDNVSSTPWHQSMRNENEET